MKLTTLLKVVFSAALLAIIATWVDLESAGAAFASADPFYLLIALLVATSNKVLMALKWNVLLIAKGIGLSWRAAVRIYFVSGFAGMFLPATVGGDAVRCLMTIREHGHHAHVVTSILVERLVGFLVLLLFGALGGFLLYEYLGDSQENASTLITAAVVLLGILFGSCVFAFSESCRRLTEGVSRWLAKRKKTEKLARFVHQLHESFLSYKNHLSAVLVFFFLTIFENLLPIFRTWIIALAMNIHVPLSYYFIIVPVWLFVVRIPISFQGFGVREGVFVYFLALAGVDNGSAFTMSLLSYLVGVIVVLPGAFLYLRERPAMVETEPEPRPEV